MNQTNFHIQEIAPGTPQYDASVALRKRWLRDPIGLPLTDQDRVEDLAMQHIGCFLGETLVGCLALLPLGERKMRVRQLIVDPNFERQGIGRALVERSEELARRQGCTQIILHARETAIDFYDRLGYQSVGQPFIEVTILHQEMIKSL